MIDLTNAVRYAEELSQQARTIQDKADSVSGMAKEIERLENSKAKIGNTGSMLALHIGKDVIPLPQLTTSQVNVAVENKAIDLISKTQAEYEKALCELMGPVVEPAKKPSKSR